MASRRSHAASHNITSISTRYKITYYSRVPRGHVYIRNPLQAAKQRSCGISIPSPSLGSAKRDLIMKPTASCEAAQLWVRTILPPHIVPRRGTDASPMMLRKIAGPASRNQERVRGSLLVPQLRSFAACSGFLIDTCPLGTRR